MKQTLYAGAGQAEIRYDAGMFPTFGENYTQVHDLPLVKALLLQTGSEAEDCCAVVSIDIVILEIREQVLHTAQKALGIPAERILLHATHVLATPHFRQWQSPEMWKNDPMHARQPVSDEEAARFMERENRMAQAHLEAVKVACEQAKSSLQPARCGFDTAFALVNVNRVVKTADGWWQGVNQDGPSDHGVAVLRFDRQDGSPLAVLYNCNTAPGCLEFSTVNGGRAVSGDMAGASERFVRRMLGDAVAIYTTGCTGDQWQALRARLDYMDADGHQAVEDLHETGFQLARILGVRLGEQVVKTAGRMDVQDDAPLLALDTYRFTYPGQSVSVDSADGPTNRCEYRAAAPQAAEIAILQIGGTAVVTCGVEVCSETYAAIRAASPYANTFLMEFTTEGGGYMPESIFYDRMSFQARKSRYARGSAEKFREDVINSLCTSWAKHRSTGENA